MFFLRSAARGPVHCSLCRAPVSNNSPKDNVSRLKKHAKKGQPWAQFELARAYTCEKSIFESKRWLEKAAKLNHPGAIYRFGTMHLCGDRDFGCDIDISKARGVFDHLLSHSWASSSPFFTEGCHLALVTIGIEIIERAIANEDPRGFETAIAILDPIATVEQAKKRDAIDAQYQLGRAHAYTGNMALAKSWCMSSFFCKLGDPECSANTGAPAVGALICCKRMGLWAQVKVWDDVAKAIPLLPTLSNDERGKRVMQLVQAKRYLRKIRGYCGFCGSLFSTTAERKLCRGCHALCYCSRECQKKHWNRNENSHREDCKASMVLKVTLKNARLKAAAMKNYK